MILYHVTYFTVSKALITDYYWWIYLFIASFFLLFHLYQNIWSMKTETLLIFVTVFLTLRKNAQVWVSNKHWMHMFAKPILVIGYGMINTLPKETYNNIYYLGVSVEQLGSSLTGCRWFKAYCWVVSKMTAKGCSYLIAWLQSH